MPETITVTIQMGAETAQSFDLDSGNIAGAAPPPVMADVDGAADLAIDRVGAAPPPAVDAGDSGDPDEELSAAPAPPTEAGDSSGDSAKEDAEAVEDGDIPPPDV